MVSALSPRISGATLCTLMLLVLFSQCLASPTDVEKQKFVHRRLMGSGGSTTTTKKPPPPPPRPRPPPPSPKPPSPSPSPPPPPSVQAIVSSPPPATISSPPPPPAGPAYAITVTVKGGLDTPSTTSKIIGVNSGHSDINSNAWAWYKRLGTNGARRFFNWRGDLVTTLGPYFGKSQLNDITVDSIANYKAAVNQLRTVAAADITLSTGTASGTFIKWSDFVNGPYGIEALNPAAEDGNMRDFLTKCKELGLEIILVGKVGCDATTKLPFSTMDNKQAAYWKEHFELYRLHYAMGVWAYNNSIENIELYNEPDIDSCIRNNGLIVTNGYEVWRDNYLIRSQAYLDAYADRAAKTGKTVTLNLSGAPFAKWQSFSSADDSNLGKYMVEDGYLTFPDLTYTAPKRKVDFYHYHIYGETGYAMNTATKTLNTYIKATTEKGPNTLSNLPVQITEYGSHTGGVWNTAEFAKRGVDDPDFAANTANQVLCSNVRTSRPLRHYYFKFSQDSSGSQPSGIVKGGFHFGENDVGPYDIGDTTRAAEGFGLVARKMTGEKPNLLLSVANKDFDSQCYGATEDAKNYFLFFGYENNTDANLKIDLSLWTVRVGNPVVIIEVSKDRMAEVAAIPIIASVSGTKVINYRQPANSIIQAIIPKTASAVSITKYTATEDAFVTAGASKEQNFGLLDHVKVGFEGSSAIDRTSVGYFKFPSVTTTNMNVALLTLKVRSAGSNAGNVLTVLGLPSCATSWTQSTLKWSNAPNLKTLTSPVARISDNVVSWSTCSPIIVGHITVPANAAGTTHQIDISDYIKDNSANPQFLIHRPVRWNAEGTGDYARTVDDISNSAVLFESSESANPPTIDVYSS